MQQSTVDSMHEVWTHMGQYSVDSRHAPLPPPPQIPSGRKSVLDAYGEIIFRAWKEATGPCLLEVEATCIQVGQRGVGRNGVGRGDVVRQGSSTSAAFTVPPPPPPPPDPQPAVLASMLLTCDLTHTVSTLAGPDASGYPRLHASAGLGSAPGTTVGRGGRGVHC